MMRLRGALLAVLGLALALFGAWVLYLVMGWAYPPFVPPGLVPQGVTPNIEGPPLQSLPGIAALIMIALGGVFGLLGLGMLVTGRRSVLLMLLALVCMAVYLAFVIKVAFFTGG